eukprot:GHVS01020338.1.p1 GENE.GHVS01020338.1~~GHVS01020338.1.p1  ORF type:complete len:436 (-),score=57.24 GHVS01020338.1:522-1829(-)
MADGADSVSSAVAAVAQAEFVAIDFEFSGLFLNRNCSADLQGHFDSCLSSVPEFLSLQIGICAASRPHPSSPHLWTLSPHNFYLLTSQSVVFSSDTSCLRFLHRNGFDFSRWMSEGRDFRRLSCIQFAKTFPTSETRLPNGIEISGMQRLVEAIIEHDKPLIVHNGLLDILHAYDKFIGELPSGDGDLLGGFCAEWLRLFRSGTYDTKYIASASQYTLLGSAGLSATALQPLRTRLTRLKPKCKFLLDPQTAHYGYTLAPAVGKEDEDDKLSHEAGYDAMVTAQVFVMELELLTSTSMNNSFAGSVKRRKTEASPSLLDLPVPMDWLSQPAYNKFKNMIGLHRVTPGYLDLLKHSKELPPLDHNHYKPIHPPPTTTTNSSTTDTIDQPLNDDDNTNTNTNASSSLADPPPSDSPPPPSSLLGVSSSPSSLDAVPS